MSRPHWTLEPPPYLVAVADLLQAKEPQLWDWFASAQAREEQLERARLQLLKSSIRLTADSHPGVFEALVVARERIGNEVPVTVYQAEGVGPASASIFVLPHEAHLVFEGALLDRFAGPVLLAVVAHELAHQRLWNVQGGRLAVADRLLAAVQSDPRSREPELETARRFRLHTEIYADRVALGVVGGAAPVIAALVRLRTGLENVDAEAYMAQAEEIHSREAAVTEGQTHPETFIRARALALWARDGWNAAAAVDAMIEGDAAPGRLDLLGQALWTERTRRLLGQLLRPRWMRTPALLEQARAYLPDLEPAGSPDDALWDELRPRSPATRDYLGHVLLDFATVDPELASEALALGFVTSARLGMEDAFDRIVGKELRMKVREVRELREQATGRVAEAEGVR